MNTRQKTTEFLKECLADSLISLMKEKPLEDITIIYKSKMHKLFSRMCKQIFQI